KAKKLTVNDNVIIKHTKKYINEIFNPEITILSKKYKNNELQILSRLLGYFISKKNNFECELNYDACEISEDFKLLGLNSHVRRNYNNDKWYVEYSNEYDKILEII